MHGRPSVGRSTHRCYKGTNFIYNSERNRMTIKFFNISKYCFLLLSGKGELTPTGISYLCPQNGIWIILPNRHKNIVYPIQNDGPMEYIWLIFSLLFALTGILGVILPLLPGTTVSYAALWLLWLYDKSCVSSTLLWIMGLLMMVLLILDQVAPICLLKIGKGSKQSMYGATIGLFAGFFLGFWGLVAGPFVGALIGELLRGTPLLPALKVASLSLVALMITTGLNLIYAVSIVVIIIASLWT